MVRGLRKRVWRNVTYDARIDPIEFNTRRIFHSTVYDERAQHRSVPTSSVLPLSLFDVFVVATLLSSNVSKKHIRPFYFSSMLV